MAATQQHFKDLAGAMAQRYTTDNGVRRRNPAYVPAAAPSAGGGGGAPIAVPFTNQATALAVVPVPTAPALEEEEEIVVGPTEGYGAAVARYEVEVEVSSRTECRVGRFAMALPDGRLRGLAMALSGDLVINCQPGEHRLQNRSHQAPHRSPR